MFTMSHLNLVRSSIRQCSPMGVTMAWWIYICLFLQVSFVVSHNREKIYDTLDSSYYCFRRLNQTHQVGCASNINGNYGIVKLVRKEKENEDLTYLTSSGSNAPYIAVISTEQFANLSLLLALKSVASKRIAGMLVLDTDQPAGYSSDRSCPNEYSSLYANSPDFGHCRSQESWNMPTADHVKGAMFQDFPFPVFLLRNSTQITLMKQKMQEYATESWPKLAVELVSPMHAAKDSVTCLRRSKLNSRFNLYDDVLCDPLGGNNIFHHTLNLTSIRKIEPNSVVILGVRQDSFSMFESLAPGADSVASSLVVALAVAEMLNQPTIKPKIVAGSKTLMYAFFDGEAFDYIGSSDTVYSLEKNQFSLVDPFRVSSDKSGKLPTLNLTHLNSFIELNQLAQYGSQDTAHQIYLHKNGNHVGPDLNTLIQLVKQEATGLDKLNVNEIGGNHPLPPSSAQSFLKKRNDSDFSALVLTNHKMQYENKFYNSFLEDGKSMLKRELLAERLTNLATLVGKVVYKLISGEALHPSEKANSATVKALLTCYLNDSNCDLFQQVQDPTLTSTLNTSRPPYSTYVSVYGQPKVLREYTRLLLFRFTGDKITVNSSTDCHKLATDNRNDQFTYAWMNGVSMGGECIKSSAYMVPTVTPALDPNTLDVIESNLPEYGLWTESKWQQTSVRIFVVPSSTTKTLTVILGVFLLVGSFAGTFFAGKYSSNFFTNVSPRGNGISVSIADTNGGRNPPNPREWSSPQREPASLSSPEERPVEGPGPTSNF